MAHVAQTRVNLSEEFFCIQRRSLLPSTIHCVILCSFMCRFIVRSILAGTSSRLWVSLPVLTFTPAGHPLEVLHGHPAISCELRRASQWAREVGASKKQNQLTDINVGFVDSVDRMIVVPVGDTSGGKHILQANIQDVLSLTMILIGGKNGNFLVMQEDLRNLAHQGFASWSCPRPVPIGRLRLGWTKETKDVWYCMVLNMPMNPLISVF